MAPLPTGRSVTVAPCAGIMEPVKPRHGACYLVHIPGRYQVHPKRCKKFRRRDPNSNQPREVDLATVSTIEPEKANTLLFCVTGETRGQVGRSLGKKVQGLINYCESGGTLREDLCLNSPAGPLAKVSVGLLSSKWNIVLILLVTSSVRP